MTENNTPQATQPRNKVHRKFYVFGPDLTGGGPGHGLVFVNEEKLLTPPRLIVRPEKGGFPELTEKPHIAYDKKLGKPPRDLESSLSGYWFVSERLKDIFEDVDPEAFAFAECDYTLPDGSKGQRHFLCDVVRSIDALDEEASDVRVKYYPNHETGVDEKLYSVVGGASLRFDEDAVGVARVFVQPRLSAKPICDQQLYNACKSAKDLKGIRFRNALKL
ncbi:DUF1629 domain-containing protein [Agrobacterium tumefaciens]|uniref:DUF1629 domain-containing protein n=1 Tax=Agrobacterium tumefaciens TaxID=358 RepID=UPI0015742DBE|nr:DUF1629 domain-containing protein [Agrobacterium tumefaciens]